MNKLTDYLHLYAAYARANVLTTSLFLSVVLTQVVASATGTVRPGGQFGLFVGAVHLVVNLGSRLAAERDAKAVQS